MGRWGEEKVSIIMSYLFLVSGRYRYEKHFHYIIYAIQHSSSQCNNIVMRLTSKNDSRMLLYHKLFLIFLKKILSQWKEWSTAQRQDETFFSVWWWIRYELGRGENDALHVGIKNKIHCKIKITKMILQFFFHIKNCLMSYITSYSTGKLLSFSFYSFSNIMTCQL